MVGFFFFVFFYEIQKQYYIHVYICSCRDGSQITYIINQITTTILLPVAQVSFLLKEKKLHYMHDMSVDRSFFFNMLFNIFRLICCQEALCLYKREKKMSMFSFLVNTNYSYNMIMVGKKLITITNN